MNIHKTILMVLYISCFSFVLAVALRGFEYYHLPIKQRPHSPLHRAFKPGGVWGHGLGIMGSGMMVLLLLYSLRKRQRFGLRFGKVSQWLNIHIFLGIMGPILVTLHTALKFGGFVSVSYYAMMAVMLSGFVGRYLYVQIPRTLSGDELTIKQMEVQNRKLTQKLLKRHRVNPRSLGQLNALAMIGKGGNISGFTAMFAIVISDLTWSFRLRKLRKDLVRQNGSVAPRELARLIKIVSQKALLMRKMRLLSAIQPMFHYWHVIHKPFAYVMFIIMFLHIAVTMTFGFRWIF